MDLADPGQPAGAPVAEDEVAPRSAHVKVTTYLMVDWPRPEFVVIDGLLFLKFNTERVLYTPTMSE